VARGRIIRRRGVLWFKVTEMAPLGQGEVPPAPPMTGPMPAPPDLAGIPEGGRDQ